MKKIVLSFFVLSFFIFPSVSHAAWWEYVNDKTIVSFIKSLFLKTKFVASKYEFLLEDSVKETVPTQNVVSPAKSVTSGAVAPQPVQVSEVVTSTVDEPALNIATLSYTKSDNELVGVDPAGVVTLKSTPTTRSSWVSFAVTTTKLSNYIYLDLDFTSESISQGVFTVFLDGKNLGYMDERFFGAVARRLVMGYSPTLAGTYIVTLRLDQFGDLSSNVVIKNVGTGFFSE